MYMYMYMYMCNDYLCGACNDVLFFSFLFVFIVHRSPPFDQVYCPNHSLDEVIQDPNDVTYCEVSMSSTLTADVQPLA